MAFINESRLPLVLPSNVARTKPDGMPTTATIDWEFLTREWYKQNAVDLNQRVTTLTGDVGTLTGRVTTTESVVANPDGSLTAQRLSTVAAQGNTSAGKITTIEGVVANPNGSMTAGRLTSVETTSNNNTANITTLQSSVNGISVRYGVYATLNNVTGGYELAGVQRADGTGPTFTFTINANTIIEGNLLVNGTITNPKIANAAVDTAKIAPNSVTLVGSDVQGAGASPSVTLSLLAGDEVTAYGYMSGAPGTDVGSGIVGTTIIIDANGFQIGFAVVNYTLNTLPSGANQYYLLTTPVSARYTIPTTGSYTFTIPTQSGKLSRGGSLVVLVTRR